MSNQIERPSRYKTGSLLYNNNTNKLVGFCGDLNGRKNLHQFIYFEQYQVVSSSIPHRLLALIISNFNDNNKINKSYIIKLSNEHEGYLNNPREIEILDYKDENSKVIHINLNDIISKIVDNTCSIDYIIRHDLIRNRISVIISKSIGNTRISFFKPFTFYQNYVTSFDNFGSTLQKDLLEFTNFIVKFNDMKMSKLLYILKDLFSMTDAHLSRKHFSLSAFNNLNIIYNNLNVKKIPSRSDYDCLSSLNDFKKILRKSPIHPPKTIQLKGIKFQICNSIEIYTGFSVIPLNLISSALEQYILTTCKIENIKIEIEKAIILGDC